MRTALINLVRDQKLAQKRDKKQAIDPDCKETKQPLLPLLKPNATLTPCLGGAAVTRNGRSMPSCVSLSYEDFDKLVVFKRGFVSGFIEDLVQYLTIGMVSAQAVETYLGHLRDEPEGADFSTYTTAETVQEFLVQKKLD